MRCARFRLKRTNPLALSIPFPACLSPNLSFQPSYFSLFLLRLISSHFSRFGQGGSHAVQATISARLHRIRPFSLTGSGRRPLLCRAYKLVRPIPSNSAVFTADKSKAGSVFSPFRTGSKLSIHKPFRSTCPVPHFLRTLGLLCVSQ